MKKILFSVGMVSIIAFTAACCIVDSAGVDNIREDKISSEEDTTEIDVVTVNKI